METFNPKKTPEKQQKTYDPEARQRKAASLLEDQRRETKRIVEESRNQDVSGLLAEEATKVTRNLLLCFLEEFSEAANEMPDPNQVAAVQTVCSMQMELVSSFTTADVASLATRARAVVKAREVEDMLTED